MVNIEETRLALKRVEEAAQVRIPVIDYDEVREAVFLDARPPELGWDQTGWVKIGLVPEGVCLTAGCLAGHVAIADGYTEPVMDRFDAVVALRNPQTGDTLCFAGPGSVGWYAQHKLGLSEDQADWLFHEDNDLDDMRLIVEDLCR